MNMFPTLSSPPDLPLELHHHILRFCDPPTLALASRVSLAFLELASPLLYGDIDITLGEQTEQLFCTRDPSHDQPQLHPFLNVTHIHTLIIRALSSDLTQPLNLSASRLPSPILIDHLTLRPLGHPLSSITAPFYPSWSTLFPLLAPTEVHLWALPSDVPVAPPRMNLEHATTWSTCLRRIVLTDILHWSYVGHSGCIPVGVTEPALEIVFNLSSWDPEAEEAGDEELLETVESEVRQELDPVGLERSRGEGRGRIERVVVQFGTEVARTAWVGSLESEWQGGDVGGDGEHEEWLSGQIEEGTVYFEVVGE